MFYYSPCQSRESNRTDSSVIGSRYYSSLSMCGYSYQNANFFSLEETDFVEVDNVRITPAAAVFRDAFEGRHYKEKIVIQNCGKNTAFIRICAPSSYAFKIKTIPYGQYLSPGLSIARVVLYTHRQKFSAPVSYIPIYINDQYLKYRLTVLKSSAVIYAQPHFIDFGTVNADSTPFSKMLILTNDGTKSSRFAVDVGINKIQLIVKPMQGIIQPKSSIPLRVEVMSHEEGAFVQELWIKCDTPFRIQISANFIVPKLKVFSTNGTSDFTFIDFPRTYFGAGYTRFLVIKNDSAIPKMFCIMAEVDRNNVMTLKEALKKRQDFRCFNIHPIEGRLQPQEGRVIEVVFAPKNFIKTSDPYFHDDYAICYIRVIQINTIDLPGGIAFKETHEHARIPAPYLSIDEDIDSLSVSLQDDDQTYSAIKLLQNQSEDDSNINSGKDYYRRICLHGECEKIDLTIHPDSLTLSDLRMNQEERRVLALKNNSKYLKLNFRYKKCPCIEIHPKEGVINSLSTLEVSVHICPSKIGHVQTNITFQILYQNLPENTDVIIGEKFISVYYSVNSVTALPKPKFNLGITPQITNEVGILTDDVRFNSPVKKPMGAMVNTRPKRFLDNDLIAFPNDRPLSLRPWTSQIPCKTIFSGIPRPKTDGGIYALSKSERETKKLLYVHYNDYIRRKRAIKAEPVTHHHDDDYDIGDGHSLLMENIRYKFTDMKEKKEKSQPFIAMTPTELYRIKIDPPLIDYGKVAANSLVSKWIHIKNENEMSVRVFLECHHNSISFKNGRRLVVSPHSDVSIQIEYKASENGRFIIPIRVIFNECHFSQVILFLEAVEKYVEIDVSEIHFYSDDLEPKHVNVRNPLNAPVTFRWEVPKSCFSIIPQQGTIEPKMTYPCLVTFNTHPKYDIRVDVILILENNSNITMPIWVEMVKPDVILERDAFVIHALPLNQLVQRKFVLRNNSFEPISVAVLNPKPATGICVFPSDYVLHGKSEMNITVELKIDAYVSFNCEVQLELQRLFILDITISGDVEFPNISIEPDELLFNKLSVGATQCLPFYIKNQSNSLVDIKLNFEDFSDFTISEKQLSHPITKSKEIVLESKTTIKMYLYFTPNDVTYYNFLLPYVINDLIGPPIIDDGKSLLPDTYYKGTQHMYVDYIKSVVEMTKSLDPIRINARANTMMLIFSSLELNFCYFPNNDYDSVTEHTLDITNIGDSDIKFCLRTDGFGTNYSLVALPNENNSVAYQNSCVCCLETKASITYKISFHPMIQGTYDVIIPVIVRDVNEDPFNYINLHGVYPVPSIETQLNVIYLKPVPLGCISRKTITLKTSYHMNNCSIKTDVSSCDLLVDFTEGNEVTFKKIHNEIQVNISFKSNISITKREQIKFSCTCPAECTIVVVMCSENSIVTNHAFLEKRSFKNFASVFTPFIYKTNFEKTEDSLCDFNDDSSSTETTLKILEEVHVFEDVVYDNDDSYPFFPVENDQSENAQYMRRCLSALENWIYEQCFYSMSYYTIPNGIASNPVNFEKNRRGEEISMPKFEENDNDKLLPFLQLLKNLGGSSVKELIPTTPLPEDHHKKIIYLYTIYNKILIFLMEEEARLLHVQAEYLLQYNSYVYYKKYLEIQNKTCGVTNEKILDEDSFCSLTKQYWMDVILQTFKIFVLSRIQLSLRERKPKQFDQMSAVSFKTHSSSLLSTYNTSFINLFKEAQLPTPDIYSTADLMLLSWLEYSFEKQRKILWPNHAILQPRHVQHFDEDLKDGIILACLTAQFCPYLSDCFQEFILQPKTYEELLFNAIRLTDAWRSIYISFHILPEQIVKPNRIQMLLLVTYLYDFLPNLIPKESLTLIAKHTLSIKETVQIKNKNDNVISYRIKLFSKYPQFFNISKTKLVINPRKDCSLEVTFHARKLTRVSAVLVLCGDTPGYKYAKSIVIKMEGIPDVTFVNGELTFEGNLYQVLEKPFSVYSPYKQAATYDLYYYPGIPQHIDELKPIAYQTLKDLKLPRRFHNKANQVKCDADGVANTFAVYCGLHSHSIHWITYYCNNEVGDFSTKTNVVIDTARTAYETVYVRLPRGLNTLDCHCGKTVSKFGKCPREVDVEMPRKNNIMWASIERMFFETLDERDIPFWTKYLETSAGNHIMKYMFDSERPLAPRDIKHIFNKTVTYKVVFDKKTPPAADFPKEITIDDVLTEGVFNVTIHLRANKPKDFYFNMVSDDDAEIRYYKMVFLPEL